MVQWRLHSAVWAVVLVAGCPVATPIGDLAATTGNSGTSTSATSETDATSSSGPATSTSTPTSTSTSTTGTTGGEIGPGPMRSFAMRFDELPDSNSGSASDVGDDGGSTGGPFAPDALVVTVTVGRETCEDPYGPSVCGNVWSISFNLPPELQAPGSYPLFPDLNGGYFWNGEEFGPGDCPGGGGSLNGTLVLEEIDDSRLVGRFENTDAIDFDANVAFDASRCF